MTIGAGTTIEYLTRDGWKRSPALLPRNMSASCAAILPNLNKMLIVPGNFTNETFFYDLDTLLVVPGAVVIKRFFNLHY